MRIALGMLTHEANSFSPHVTDLADFGGRQLVRGDDLLMGWEGTNTEQAGALAVLSEDAACQVVPLLGARALSGAPIDRGAFDQLLGELLERLRAALPVDGVLLVLHGAMMVAGGADGSPPIDDATGEVLAQVRALVGPSAPVVGTLDLHANVTPRMVNAASALVGYQTAPHVDMAAVGQRAAEILLATIRGEVAPTTALVRLPMILPPENADHRMGPLHEVIQQALEVEARPEVLRANVYSVQPWLDAPNVASTITVTTDGKLELADALARELAAAFWARRERFQIELVSPDEAIARAMARDSGTIVLCDSADATTSGSTGDSTAILAAALAAAPLPHPALLNVVDPQAVAAAIAAGVGNEVTVTVGGTLAPRYFQPVPFSGRVKLLSDGEFRFEGPGMRGMLHHMGRTAVLVRDNIHLVVMERAVSQWDPQLYRSQALDPAAARVVQVKSPRAFRAAYDAIAEEVIVVRAPGAASPELTALPWQRLGRPIYPLDEDLSWP